jgi:hypothetical protein
MPACHSDKDGIEVGLIKSQRQRDFYFLWNVEIIICEAKTHLNDI